MRGQLEAKAVEAESMTTLSLQGEATLQMYMTQLKVGLLGCASGACHDWNSN